MYIKGGLSFADKENGNWKKSIPFYMDFPNRLTENDAKYGNIVAKIYLSIGGNKLGKEIEPKEFIEGNHDGHIVYHIE